MVENPFIHLKVAVKSKHVSDDSLIIFFIPLGIFNPWCSHAQWSGFSVQLKIYETFHEIASQSTCLNVEWRKVNSVV